MMEAVNLTHRVERAVLEQRLEDAEQNVAIRDLKLHWMSLKHVRGRDGQQDNDQLVDPAFAGQCIRHFTVSAYSKHSHR